MFTIRGSITGGQSVVGSGPVVAKHFGRVVADEQGTVVIQFVGQIGRIGSVHLHQVAKMRSMGAGGISVH